MKFEKVENNIYQIAIRGKMGNEIDEVANKLDALVEAGAEQITFNINTGGGLLIPAVGLATAIKNARAKGVKVIAQIEHLAASAGALISQACSPVNCQSYSMVMFHGTQGGDKETNAMFNKSLFAYLKEKTGKADEVVNKLISADNWFNASEAKAAGFVDHISEGIANLLKLEEEDADTFAVYNSIINVNNNLKMEKVEQLQNEVQTLSTKADVLEAKNEALEAKNTALTNELKEVKENANRNEATAFVSNLIEAGKLKPETKDKMIENYISNPSMVKNMFDSLTETASIRQSPANALDEGITPNASNESETDAERYVRLGEADELKNLSDPELEKLENAYEKTL